MASSEPVPRLTLITGAGGFVGRALVLKLASLPDQRFRLLLRRPEALGLRLPDNCTVLSGDLTDPATRAAAVDGADSVLHMAAITGKAAPAAYRAVNEEATAALAAAAKTAGVSRFLFVSTIAAGYADQRYYPYAQSKAAAEAALARSGLNYTILRPTIVMGAGSPIAETLAKIAGAPILPLLQKSGPVEVQPVHVDDVVRALLRLLDDHAPCGDILELGGPERLSFRAFLGRLHMELTGKAARFLPFPLAPVQWGLALLEPLARPVMPATAGQLAVFANPSTAADNWLMADLAPGMTGLDRMLTEAAAGDPPSAPPPPAPGGQAEPRPDDSTGDLARECRAFTTYLVGRDPGPGAISAYGQGIARLGLVPSPGSFDAAALRLARRGLVPLAALDAHGAIFARTGTLRGRLILLLAILEKLPPTARVCHDPPPRGRLRGLLRLAVAGLTAAAALILGLGMAALLWLGAKGTARS